MRKSLIFCLLCALAWTGTVYAIEFLCNRQGEIIVAVPAGCELRGRMEPVRGAWTNQVFYTVVINSRAQWAVVTNMMAAAGLDTSINSIHPYMGRDARGVERVKVNLRKALTQMENSGAITNATLVFVAVP